MKATDYIARSLYERGVRIVFEMSGGMITHLLDSIHLHGKIRLVSMHHEQGAAFAADGVGRMTGVPGVALATSGPGATNLVTGIGSCYFDSSPAVFITGQVNRSEQKGTRTVRQLGFQETDIVSVVRPITKAAWMIRSPEEIPSALDEAFRIATSGRPGPVLLDIPMDVQREDVTPTAPAPEKRSVSSGIDPAFFGSLYETLWAAKRPLVLAGGGVRSGRALDLFRRFIARLGVPTVHSLMGVDLLPHCDPLRVGLIGSYGNRWANLALAKADVVLVLGSRLDVRQTGSDTKSFSQGKKIYHVDCEPGEMNNRITGCVTLTGELGHFLAESAKFKNARVECSEWLNEISDLRRTWPDQEEARDVQGINPNAFMHELSNASKTASAFVVDVGQHQMWAAQSLQLEDHQRFITSGGMGSMGFALPAAIGVAITAPNSPVVVIAGDGGFQSNIQELETVRYHNLPLKILVINNKCHGMVRQFQESYFKAHINQRFGVTAPNFEHVGNAYGIASKTAEDPREVPAPWNGCARTAMFQPCSKS